MNMPVGALVSKRDESGDGVARGVSDRCDGSGGGFGEDFDGRVPAAGGEMDGVGGKHGGVGRMTCGECPPRQAGKHSDLTGGNVEEPAMAGGRGGEGPRPGQIAGPTGGPPPSGPWPDRLGRVLAPTEPLPGEAG